MTRTQERLLADIEAAKITREKAEDRGDFRLADSCVEEIFELQLALFRTGYVGEDA